MAYPAGLVDGWCLCLKLPLSLCHCNISPVGNIADLIVALGASTDGRTQKHPFNTGKQTYFLLFFNLFLGQPNTSLGQLI